MESSLTVLLSPLGGWTQKFLQFWVFMLLGKGDHVTGKKGNSSLRYETSSCVGEERQMWGGKQFGEEKREKRDGGQRREGFVSQAYITVT